MNVSKELLSEVLGTPVEIISIDEHKCEIKNSISFENYQLGVSYSYLYGNKEIRFMPVHELAHECKEWASSKGYHIYSHNKGCHIHYNIASFKADTEPEAIFAACQWILDNKDKQ